MATPTIPEQACWNLRFMGRFRAIGPTGAAHTAQLHPDLLGLLYRLGQSPGLAFTYSSLADYLRTPGSPQERQAVVANYLQSLRALLEPRSADAGTVLTLGAGTVIAVPGSITMDVADFERGLTARFDARGPTEVVDQILPLLADNDGRFMVGCRAGWARRERTRLRKAVAAALADLAVACAEIGREAACEGVLGRLRAMGPLGPAAERLARLSIASLTGSQPVTERTNLPPRFGPFLGRHLELTRVHGMLASDTRLANLTGPPGCGKSRLALEAAHALSAQGMPVWRADLVGADTPPEVEWRITQALPTETIRALGPLDGIRRVLGAGEGLLLLDGADLCEQAAAPLAACLLGAFPRLRVLATSRTPINRQSECVIGIGPLRSAFSLFLARAGITAPDVRARAMANAICVGLGDWPLPVILVADGCRGPRAESRLATAASCFGGLRERDAETAVAAALDWRLAQMTGEERQAFVNLATFAGWFNAHDAAGALRWDGAEGALMALVQADLLECDESGNERLYRVPLALRGAMPLGAPAHQSATERHARWFLGADRTPTGSELGGDSLLDLRSAIRWGAASDPDAALLCLVRLQWSLIGSRRAFQVVDLLPELIQAAGGVSEFERGCAHLMAAIASSLAGRSESEETHTSEAGRIGEAIGSAALCGAAQTNLAMARSELGDMAEAARLCGMGVAQLRAAGDRAALAQGLSSYSAVLVMRGDGAAAQAAVAEALRIYADLDGHPGLGSALHNQAEVHRARGRIRQAETAFAEALAVRMRTGDQRRTPTTLGAVAELAVAKRQYYRALVLFRATRRLRAEMGLASDPITAAAESSGAARAASELDTHEVLQAERKAQSLDVGGAAAYAAASAKEPPTPGVRGGYRDIRPAERATLRKAAELGTTSDQALADELYIQPSTVKGHWRDVMRRLGITGRATVLEYVRANGLLDDDQGGSTASAQP